MGPVLLPELLYQIGRNPSGPPVLFTGFSKGIYRSRGGGETGTHAMSEGGGEKRDQLGLSPFQQELLEWSPLWESRMYRQAGDKKEDCKAGNAVYESICIKCNPSKTSREEVKQGLMKPG